MFVDYNTEKPPSAIPSTVVLEVAGGMFLVSPQVGQSDGLAVVFVGERDELGSGTGAETLMGHCNEEDKNATWGWFATWVEQIRRRLLSVPGASRSTRRRQQSTSSCRHASTR
jgi:hypothetical protein